MHWLLFHVWMQLCPVAHNPDLHLPKPIKTANEWEVSLGYQSIQLSNQASMPLSQLSIKDCSVTVGELLITDEKGLHCEIKFCYLKIPDL